MYCMVAESEAVEHTTQVYSSAPAACSVSMIWDTVEAFWPMAT